jgi:hypothetical protein
MSKLNTAKTWFNSNIGTIQDIVDGIRVVNYADNFKSWVKANKRDIKDVMYGKKIIVEAEEEVMKSRKCKSVYIGKKLNKETKQWIKDNIDVIIDIRNNKIGLVYGPKTSS